MELSKILSAVLLLCTSVAVAQQLPTTQPAPIPREDYERLLRDTSDPAAAGSLDFQDFTDLDNGKAIGGCIGFLCSVSRRSWLSVNPNCSAT
jgi:hypothetical protein